MARRTADNELRRLREAIREEYDAVANDPGQGFHFHTGRKLLALLDYDQAWLEGLSELAIESAAGTGNPFRVGPLRPGDRVVDVGSGSGLDSLIAGTMVGPDGWVIGVDMTPSMVDKARAALAECPLDNVTFRHGFAEALPVPDNWADVVISNGVLNLMPDKEAALREMARVLKPNGRLQIADILVKREVPESAKRQIDLWTG